ncbi:hypothetical protein [uncultured Alistipes sp.]|uniref:hypothetical protein n=1 Tax=Alistipes sp. TaxID=1872444 RepID=UPI002591350D|nr:hypothetical protein [uncultured Alistipes sp.]
MKKLILSAVVLLSVSSCNLLKIFQMDPFEPEHTTEWYIKNLSDETIVITTRNLYGARTVEVGDSVCIIAFHPWQSKGIQHSIRFLSAGKPTIGATNNI